MLLKRCYFSESPLKYTIHLRFGASSVNPSGLPIYGFLVRSMRNGFGESMERFLPCNISHISNMGRKGYGQSMSTRPGKLKCAAKNAITNLPVVTEAWNVLEI